MQILLTLKYRELAQAGSPLPDFSDVGFQAYSQNDEDGILLYIFALAGATNRRCLEICAGDGIECNTANLIVNHGWRGLLFDGSKEHVERGRQFYASRRETRVSPPVLADVWIDAENINSLITQYRFEGEVDLLSLDIDGVDYWIWKALECVRPRVVVLEYQPAWGAEKAMSVPYKRDFRAVYVEPYYMGASLPAFVKLGREKGYRLVGCNRHAFNAFFVRCDVAADLLPEVPISRCIGRFVDPAEQQRVQAAWAKYEWAEV